MKPGKQLRNTNMIRLADGVQWGMHDNLIPDGNASFKLLVFCGRDLILDQHGTGSHSAEALKIFFERAIPVFLIPGTSTPLLDTYVVAPDMVYAPDTGGPSSTMQLFSLSMMCGHWFQSA